MEAMMNNQTAILDIHKSRSGQNDQGLLELRSKSDKKIKRSKRLTRSEIKHFKSKLLAKRGEVLETLSGIQQGVIGADSGDMGPMDSADRALFSETAEENSRLLGSERSVLEEINEALERIQKGTYGLCLNCRRQISKRRLQAIPWARYCVPCANEGLSSKQTTNEHDKRRWAEKQARRLQGLFEQWLKVHGIDSQEFYNFEVKELLNYYEDPLRRSLIESLC